MKTKKAIKWLVISIIILVFVVLPLVIGFKIIRYKYMTCDQIISDIVDTSYWIGKSSLWIYTPIMVNSVNDPEVLGEVINKSYNKMRIAKDEIFSTTYYYESLESSILSKLVDMNTDASVKVLVDLRLNTKLGWDAGRSETLSYLISKCGKKALPYLKEGVNSENQLYINDLIKCIENGKLYI